MITAFRHTGIVVSNLEASMRFYVELLGFYVVRQAQEFGEHLDKLLGLEHVRVTTVKMAAPDGGMIELLHFESHPRDVFIRLGLSDIGISHIALTVDDLDADYARLRAAGVPFTCAPQWSVDSRHRLAFCRDPDQNFIELVQEFSYPRAV